MIKQINKIIKENYEDLKQLYVFEIQENEKLKKLLKERKIKK